MHMIIHELPIWLLAFVIVIVPALVALMCPAAVRRFVSLEKLSANNEVAGFKFATVGVLYAVLLAFVVIVVWERYNSADNDVSREAAAVAIMYRLSPELPDGQGPAFREKLTAYLATVLKQEFPEMAEGKRSAATTVALDAVYEQILSYKANTPRDSVVLAELLRQIDTVTQSRRSRLLAALGSVPGVLWGVLVVGAFATLGFTLFFGTSNLRAQSMMTCILAVLLFSGLLVVVSFDHPFSGDMAVKPHAIRAILSDFGGVKEPNGR